MGLCRRWLVIASLAAGATAKVKFEDKWRKFCGEPDCYTELGLLPNATKVSGGLIADAIDRPRRKYGGPTGICPWNSIRCVPSEASSL